MNSGSRNQVMPGARMRWIVTMKLRPVRIDEKPVMKMPERRRNDVGRRRDGAERRVEGPAGVDAAGDERVQREQPAEDVDVPAGEVQLRKGQILGADHDRHEEVAEHRRDDGNQEEEHHHHAVHGEELVVGLVRDEIAGRRRQVEPDQHGERAADEEEQRDGRQVQQRDALVIARQQPRLDAVAVVQIVMRRNAASVGMAISVSTCGVRLQRLHVFDQLEQPFFGDQALNVGMIG